MQVEVFSDVVCPWCYIGKRRLEEALDSFAHRTDVTVTYRSFQLDPSTPTEVTGSQAERLAEKYGIPLDQAEAMNRRVSEVAADAGLHFDLDIAHPANTFDAHRLLHFAAERGKQAEVAERLLAGHFTRGEHVGDREQLADIAAEAGLDRDEAATMLAGDEYAAAVREDLSLARSFGISSVPFFVIDRKYGIAGAQSAAVLAEALDTAWRERHPLSMVGAGGDGQPAGIAAAGDEPGCADGTCTV